MVVLLKLKKAFEKANTVLNAINTYMKCNLLHINIKKCCYMHFKPNMKNDATDYSDLTLVLGHIPIKPVSETKFLGVIIDDKLSWLPHIKYLNTKLNCGIGKLNRIRHLIPPHLHKNLYYTLFESHLSYGISAWGGDLKSLNPIFITQKKCIRMMFGDRDKYLDKFKTCARTRSYANRILGTEFYKKEACKPLFDLNDLLTVHSLYKYHCLLKRFKIIKFRKPMSYVVV